MESEPFLKEEEEEMEKSNRSSSLEPKVNYLNQIHESLHKFLGEFWDLVGYGNCVFRVIAKSLGYDEHGWFKVQKELIETLRKNKKSYSKILGGIEDVEKIEKRLDVNDINENIPS